MSRSVMLSDELVREARIAARASKRSLAGQIEHWARLGQAVDAAVRVLIASGPRRPTRPRRGRGAARGPRRSR